MGEHRMTRKDKMRIARIPKVLEVLLRETARKVCSDSENVDDPMVAAQDDESWSSRIEISG